MTRNLNPFYYNYYYYYYYYYYYNNNYYYYYYFLLLLLLLTHLISVCCVLFRKCCHWWQTLPIPSLMNTCLGFSPHSSWLTNKSEFPRFYRLLVVFLLLFTGFMWDTGKYWNWKQEIFPSGKSCKTSSLDFCGIAKCPRQQGCLQMQTRLVEMQGFESLN